MARAGAKGAISADPLDFAGWPGPGWRRLVRFAQEFVVVPKGAGAGEPFKLRPWQVEIVKGLFPYRGGRPRTGLVSLPRGNGKTTLAAVLALYELFASETVSPQVMVAAGTEQVARHTLKIAQRMIELSPELAARAHLLQHSIKVPHTGGEMVTAASTVAALQGYDPSLLIVDELHTVSTEDWEAATSVAGKRPQSLTLAISTPSDSQESVMWELVQHGRKGDDPQFYFREFAADTGCDILDHDQWAKANPALGDFLTADGLLSVAKTMREAAFRRYRLGQWVGAADTWLPFGVWDKLAVDRQLQPGEKITLGFDGSASGDSTALVACTMDGFVAPIAVWSNPNDPGWRVPRHEVTETVAECFERYDVVELAADPWGWRSELEDWAKKFGERHVIEYNTAYKARMAPASDRFYAAVMDGLIHHDGDRTLSAHMGHVVAEQTAVGAIIRKDKRNSPRKIDAAVTAVIAFDRAQFHSKKKKRRVAAW
ncbi:terminase large subunit domain-containing protein [Pseudoclavibacter sp. CFCC 13611]|uniref:terminase large subunit domain-containing protein n=1 Tax=Pseudoclavibacter sp. CFCC 13611 TaxID=2615178 RepID=UPI0013017E91|nr:terminase large subunit [Pseudoclavibacter sp. CFCC 13611]KAB1662827.1 terminase large subunit [Pseudoclavibacter sp. CFCC 13611]